MNEKQKITALEIELEYMQTSRDAWQREAEALRAAMLKWSRRVHDLECDATFRDTAADTIQQHTKSRLEKRRILQPSATPDSSEKDALTDDIKTSEKARQIMEQIMQIFDADFGLDSTVNSARKSSIKLCCNRCTD